MGDAPRRVVAHRRGRPDRDGTNVAFSAPLPIGFIDGTCRIVVVDDEPNRYGFAYGTLSVHPERGEESFVVLRDDDGNVRLDIDGVSRPAHPLAGLAPPFADHLQDGAVRRYLAAMQTLTRGLALRTSDLTTNSRSSAPYAPPRSFMLAATRAATCCCENCKMKANAVC